jgi:transcriptional regulator with XRE-family HTH domain
MTGTPDVSQTSRTPTFAAAIGVAVAQRRALADFLRRKRDAIAPRSVGLVPQARRRCPGLSREEVADRAGVSVAWYTWLEQARDIRASDALIERLAAALLLTNVEREHLHMLAKPPSPRDGAADVSPALRQWIDGLAPCPAYLIDGQWNVLVWNEAASALLGDFGALPPDERNVLWRLFCDSTWRALFADWREVAASAVAQFRRQTAMLPATGASQRLVRRLRNDSAEFAALWARHDLAAPQIWQKRIDHPRLGRLMLTYSVLQPLGEDSNVAAVVYTPGLSATAPPKRKRRRD